MIWDPATLASLSAPGFNRNIGSGDVVPYWGQQPDSMTVAGANPATPGATFDPGSGGTTSPQAAIPNTFLNNLSSLQPLIDLANQMQQAAAIPSGQGNAQAQPAAAAVPGAGSTDIAAQAGALPVAGAPLPSSGIGAPGIAPQGWTSGEGAAGTPGESGGPAGNDSSGAAGPAGGDSSGAGAGAAGGAAGGGEGEGESEGSTAEEPIAFEMERDEQIEISILGSAL